MKNNNSQCAKDWINDLIIALKPGLYKPTRRYLRNFIVGAMLVCGTVADWIRAVGQQKCYSKFYNQIERLGVNSKVSLFTGLLRLFCLYFTRLVKSLSPVMIRP